jgi:excisionase family DNA binding protein
MDEHNQLLTVEEVARLLQVPRSWVYQTCRPGTLDPLAHIKLGKYLRFDRGEVLHYLERLKRTSPAPVSDGA